MGPAGGRPPHQPPVPGRLRQAALRTPRLGVRREEDRGARLPRGRTSPAEQVAAAQLSGPLPCIAEPARPRVSHVARGVLSRPMLGIKVTGRCRAPSGPRPAGATGRAVQTLGRIASGGGNPDFSGQESGRAPRHLRRPRSNSRPLPLRGCGLAATEPRPVRPRCWLPAAAAGLGRGPQAGPG